MESSTVLFLCPHNVAKSVIAAAYFNQMAAQCGLSLHADSAGTDPSDAMSPAVIAMMNGEGIDVSQHQPRRVTTAELVETARIVSIGCTPEALGEAAERVAYWNDVPMVSQDPVGARTAIHRHVTQLITELQGG